MRRTDRLAGALLDRARRVDVQAVQDLSLSTSQGECLGIIGANGSGKSTLLRAIAGLTSPTRGRVLATAQPVLLGVSAALLPNATGSDNVMVGGLALGLSKSEVRERFQDVVALADLGAALHQPMRTYSSGMSARLRFAIATLARPEILLIDEALNAGDAAFQERSRARIAELTEAAGTVVLVSHSAALVQKNCSRVIWLEAGHVVADGAPDDVLSAYREQSDRRARVT